jgi:hypothetical protein
MFLTLSLREGGMLVSCSASASSPGWVAFRFALSGTTTSSGCCAQAPGREVWVHVIDDVADVAQQVFEIQLPFVRRDTAPA